MGNIKINGVSYTEKRAMELGIHPDKKKKKNSERQAKLKKIRAEEAAKNKAKESGSFQDKVSEDIKKK